ncbi:hypothetical protein BST27_03415 [Mycobacterium intermedium]|uniref:Uncharacterized protein n=1 Tax=Mycobacterium intermedium TaxID=28445 RepID=A0A1E3RZP3_MYCIE|nr:hypothetical protein [Mycobacterium intermedium]MCV6965918.1 hypothetical protein [Mycobacterium intermedium]ODQ95329.1 hypothetical protein BHQ20_29285 [Mycobacterium intermedium]OPE45942.1 hypothetical protein BV508_27860 [Mycobacterium intermedium]ORB10109.1 hypothetical protein BST27_03415 [Mycobacterium intermedium]
MGITAFMPDDSPEYKRLEAAYKQLIRELGVQERGKFAVVDTHAFKQVRRLMADLACKISD